jgi:uncharacterized protein (DUF1501 family)
MRRRQLLRTGLMGAVGMAPAGRLWAAPTGSPRLLFVFLRGGYDAASLLVASASSYYREVRPNIAIPMAAPGIKGAAALSGEWALHPALEASILPLANARQATFIPFAGSDDTSRSHFETQDSIELGQDLGGHRDFGSGFLNRLAGVLQGRDAIAFTDQLPLALRGSVDVANLSLKNEPKAGDRGLRDALAGMYREHPLQGRMAGAFEVRDEAVRDIAGGGMSVMSGSNSRNGMVSESQAANRNAITAKGFELEARRIARLMRERYALGLVDVGGWDTHVAQGAATGYLASRLDELGRGLAAFADELGPSAWRDTVVVVLSEFGRTVRENGNRGTDHGHGSVHWVLGGSLASGPVAGEQVRVEARTLFQNRDWPVLNEYRSVLGGLLARQFALTPAQVDRVFPGARPRDLGLV